MGHCALRREVMGGDAVGNEATPEQIAEMRALLGEALEAGGLGFSTTQSFTHSDGSGQPVPSRWATPDELLALCDEVSEHPGTTLEWVTDGCLSGFADAEIDLMIDMSLRGQRPINWNVLTVDSAVPERSRGQLEASAEAERRGARVVALTMPTIVGMNMSFLTYCALNQLPDWGEILSLPVDERMAKLADTETRIHMENRAAAPEAGVFARLDRLGPLPHRRHVQRGQRGAQGSARRRHRPRAWRAGLLRPARHRARRRPAHRAVAGADRRRRRELAPAGRRLALAATPCSAAPMPAPTSTACAARPTRPSSSATACGASS